MALNNQSVPLRTSGAGWKFLEPAMNPSKARTDNIMLKKAGAGVTLAYPAGQIVCQKDDGTNEFAKKGTSGYAGPHRIMKYPTVIDEYGNMQMGDTFLANSSEIFRDSVDAYYVGFFFCQDLTGTKDATVGRLIRGTYTTGILELGAATAVALA